MSTKFILGAAFSVLCVSVAGASGGGDQYAAKSTAGVPTFSKDVAPILYKNCVGCHRPGEIGPMSLLTYKDARPWAKSIRDEVTDGVMPPWHADPKHGKFANDRSLSQADKDTLAKWANGGAPEGNPADLPALPTFTEGWQLGAPDALFQLPVEYKVPADGFVEYEYFEIPTNFTEDKWMQAIEVRPGNRGVVHHVIVSVRSPKPERRPAGFRLNPGMDLPPGQSGGPEETADAPKRTRGQSLFPPPQRIGSGIGGYVPGNGLRAFDPGTAMLIRAGSTIVVQMHYTPTGTPQTDRTKIGLYLSKAAPKEEMRATALVNGQLRIPPGAADYTLTAEMTAMADITLRSLLPHTHVRGKSWEYTAIYPDGRTEVILSVPKYDFNWQNAYVFAEPLKLPKGTKIRAVARYDNSASNKANPDPKAEVKWGDQTWEEMHFTSVVFTIDGVAPGTVIATPPSGGGH
jgi:hypothetical protein